MSLFEIFFAITAREIIDRGGGTIKFFSVIEPKRHVNLQNLLLASFTGNEDKKISARLKFFLG
jgi:hypothetical protein